MMAIASTPLTTAVRGRFISVARRTSPKQLVVVRSTPETAEEATSSNSATYFYGGKSYTQEEWNAATASGAIARPEPIDRSQFVRGDDQYENLPIGDIMAFSGAGPELINGRLAMLAFIAALGAELSSGETVLRQWASEPTGVLLTFITFSVASLIPMLQTTKREALGPFTPQAEMLNGRAAMLGFASLLVVEAIRGTALF